MLQAPLFAALALVWDQPDARDACVRLVMMLASMTPEELDQDVDIGLSWLDSPPAGVDTSGASPHLVLQFLKDCTERRLEPTGDWSHVLAVPLSGDGGVLAAMAQRLQCNPTPIPPGPSFPRGARVEWLDEAMALPAVFQLGLADRRAILDGTFDVSAANRNPFDGGGGAGNAGVAIDVTRIMVGVLRAPQAPPEEGDEEARPDWLWPASLASVYAALVDLDDCRMETWMAQNAAAQAVISTALSQAVPPGAPRPAVGRPGYLRSAVAAGAATMLVFAFSVEQAAAPRFAGDGRGVSGPGGGSCRIHLSPSLGGVVPGGMFQVTLEEGLGDGLPGSRLWGPYACPMALVLENEECFGETLVDLLGGGSSIVHHDDPSTVPSAPLPAGHRLH